jgi:hypothetical protein
MKRLLLTPLLVTGWLLLHAQNNDFNADSQLNLALEQYEQMLAAHSNIHLIPHSINKDGSPRDMPADWWCSGFFGGICWKLYDFSGASFWRKAANKWSMAVKKERFNTSTHDLGFMIYCPFGNGYQLTKRREYRRILLTAARSLASRFDPQRGVIKSWDTFHEYDYPVIIDNMMNLEFLFWAFHATGDSSYYRICISHADSTLKNHFRSDYSSFHVVCYGPHGEVLARKTHQGYSDASAWSRGQAWGLYGYTVMYRETRNPKYLQQAEGIANFYMHHPNMPEDGVPYWDFNAPGIPKEERDASAAAIACSALLELQQWANEGKRNEYIQFATKQLKSLSSPAYRSRKGENGNFLLKHSVGHKPGGIEVDVPLIYADYYYIEALQRYRHLREGFN